MSENINVEKPKKELTNAEIEANRKRIEQILANTSWPSIGPKK